MKGCGVEIKGNEAIICLLSYADGLFNLPDCRVQRVALEKPGNRQALKDFQFAFAKLMEDYQVSHVYIRERQTRGKFAGEAVGFKLEAAIQLLNDVEVELLSPSASKEAIKLSPLPVQFADTGLKVFQELAFTTAYAGLVKNTQVSNKNIWKKQ